MAGTKLLRTEKMATYSDLPDADLSTLANFPGLFIRARNFAGQWSIIVAPVESDCYGRLRRAGPISRHFSAGKRGELRTWEGISLFTNPFDDENGLFSVPVDDEQRYSSDW